MNNLSISIPDDQLIRTLYITMRTFTKGVNDVLKEFDLYSSEWSVLNFVHTHSQITQSEIAAALAVENAAISKTLRNMERKGLITRTLSPGDRREKRISLSTKGKALFPQAQQAIAAHRSQALSNLSQPDRDQLYSYIHTILQTIRT